MAAREPMTIVVNFWEIRPSMMGAHLENLVRSGVRQIAAFVPWSAVESDISHLMPRFLQSAYERKLQVKLIVSPEPGVHFPFSGIARDLLSKSGALAKSAQGENIPAVLPPTFFQLPSLGSGEFQKRYQHFLARVDSLLGDLCRSQPGIEENIELIVGGSFWKYYRSPRIAAAETFSGLCGDFNDESTLQFRKRLDQFYSQREFVATSSGQGTTGVDPRWKTRAMEAANWKAFSEQQEQLFRARSHTYLRRRAPRVSLENAEIFVPEADPALVYSQYAQNLLGYTGDFRRLTDLIDQYQFRLGNPAATETAADAKLERAPWVYWSGLGSFGGLSDPEKQYLILQSLLTFASRGGGVLIDENEWFDLSASFRMRVEHMARALCEGELKARVRASFLTAHLWSEPTAIWTALKTALPSESRLVSDLDVLDADQSTRLWVVDPELVMTRSMLEQILARVTRGNAVVVLPQKALLSPWAENLLREFLSEYSGGVIRLNVQFPCEVYSVRPTESEDSGTVSPGKLLLVQWPQARAAQGELTHSYQKFVENLLSLAGVSSPCNVSDPRVRTFALSRKGGRMGVFVMNRAPASVSAELMFSSEVRISDLASRLAAQSVATLLPGQVALSDEDSFQSGLSHWAQRFALDVPAFGVLPLSVEGWLEDPSELQERQAARETSEALKRALGEAAANELYGFYGQSQQSAGVSGGMSPWN